MNRVLSAILSLLLAAHLCLGQTAFMQLTPGQSTRSDAERVLGEPINNVTETLIEYRPKQSGQQLFIQYDRESAIIERLVFIFNQPIARAGLANLLDITQQADTKKWDAQGRLEEYFGSTRLIVVTHETSEVTSSVVQIVYYSPELFAVVLEKPTGQAQLTSASQPSVTSQPSADAPTAPSRTSREVFDEVELLVTRGDKADEKSVRLIFDIDRLVVEADKGSAVFKSFPYASIKGADYSYSKHPRWKAGLGAAIFLGVFALPIFFMKSKKHWLTIKTADDFAILRLDKKNYKIILPTLETSTGKKVETVADDK